MESKSIERQSDAVVGDAALGEVVGSNPFAAITAADLILAFVGAFGILLLNHLVQQARAQNFHALGFVLVLGFFVLANHHQARWANE